MNKKEIPVPESVSEIQNLKQENQILTEMINLKDEAFFRQQLLLNMIRISTAIESLGNAFKNYSEGIDDDEGKVEETEEVKP